MYNVIPIEATKNNGEYGWNCAIVGDTDIPKD